MGLGARDARAIYVTHPRGRATRGSTIPTWPGHRVGRPPGRPHLRAQESRRTPPARPPAAASCSNRWASHCSGGITSAIPLITKGRAEAETAAADVNYFFGIDASSGKLVADFEEAQVAQGGTTPGLNHPITGTAVIAADSTWHHAAATYDGTTWNLYLDGSLDGTLSVGRPANALTNSLTSVGSARTTAGTAAGFFAGVVDEVRIWNMARSPAQINATKNVEIASPQPNLLGVWNLNVIWLAATMPSTQLRLTLL